jgi:hypothetical protein
MHGSPTLGSCGFSRGAAPPLSRRLFHSITGWRRSTICSAATAGSGGVQGICEVTPLSGGGNKIKLNLTAQTGKIVVGGYGVETEHYNASYLAPVIEAMPGDTVAARLVNRLEPRTPSDGHAGHGAANENPTNLHYFHGGIVTPKNARPPEDAGKGDGDNIFVYLKNGKGSDFSFEYEVPIPGKDGLDARVLEADGSIEHPSGLNWYHSHLHGRSSDQIMGGLSGLLSVGDAKANVAAVCRDPANPPVPERHRRPQGAHRRPLFASSRYRAEEYLGPTRSSWRQDCDMGARRQGLDRRAERVPRMAHARW